MSNLKIVRTANKKGGGWEFIIFISIIDQVAGRLRSENGPIKSSSERRSLPAGQHLPAWVTSGCLSVADFFKRSQCLNYSDEATIVDGTRDYAV